MMDEIVIGEALAGGRIDEDDDRSGQVMVETVMFGGGRGRSGILLTCFLSTLELYYPIYFLLKHMVIRMNLFV